MNDKQTLRFPVKLANTVKVEHRFSGKGKAQDSCDEPMTKHGVKTTGKELALPVVPASGETSNAAP